MPDVQDVLRDVTVQTDSKIVLIVMDGVGGLPKDGKTELEAANTPNLDALAAEGICGLTDPVSRGITPGSGPAHLGLFGYDPLRYEIGRGVMEALGIGMEVRPGDVAARSNFATLRDGMIVDRRAGRPKTERNLELVAKLRETIKSVEDVEVVLKSGEEHRFALVFRGEGLDGRVVDADPGKEDDPPRAAVAFAPEAEKMARIANEVIRVATETLADCAPANTILMRGFAALPHIPSMGDLFKLTAAAIAAYPMYRGLAQLVGMNVLDAGHTLEEEFETLEKSYGDYDFFYLHVKKTDSRGEDGDFDAKVAEIERADQLLPKALALEPDVVVVTADHSTPSVLSGHSWHPNPFMLRAKTCRPDEMDVFTERACTQGGLGRFRAVHAMPLMLAHALKTEKFGA